MSGKESTLLKIAPNSLATTICIFAPKCNDIWT